MILEPLSRALAQTADSVLIADRDGVIEYVNPAFEKMTGFSRDIAIGNTPRLLRSGIQTTRFYETLWNTILSGRTFQTTITNRRRDGRLFDQEQTITPIRDASGTITHFVSTGRDVTQRQHSAAARLHHQLELEATRTAGVLHDEAGQYLALAHITLSEVARTVAQPQRDRLQEVRAYLDFVEERLRDAARGIQPRVVADLGLVEAIKFLAERYERRTGVRITVEASLEIRCPAFVESLMYRFVQDALTNVGQHAQAKSATITIARQIGGRRAEDNIVCCAVRDDGSGFDVNSLQDLGRGSISLRIIRNRIEGLGGTFTVTSAPGEGTEVRACVPLESRQGSAASAAPEDGAAQTS